MKIFYDSPEIVQSLRFHAAEIVGTPFAYRAMVPGAGMDCIHAAAWVYLKTGFFKDFNPPKYALDSGSHAKDSQVLKWLDENPQFSKLKIDDGFTLRAGDLLCINARLVEHHVGLMLDDSKFVHVLPNRRVVISSLNESYYLRRVTAVYRPIRIQ